MDMEQVKMTKPLIQIDDEVREMTDDEYSDYLIAVANESQPEIETSE
jgi:hypothetical protein